MFYRTYFFYLVEEKYKFPRCHTATHSTIVASQSAAALADAGRIERPRCPVMAQPLYNTSLPPLCVNPLHPSLPLL